MAILINTETKQPLVLRTQHIFGRHSGSSQTILKNPEASRLHASVFWNGSHWLIQDNSSNGTFLNNALITAGTKNRLKVGDSIQFGALNACIWIFNNEEPPKSLLVSLVDGINPIELEGVVVLPNEASPEITIYQVASGQWVFENSIGITTLESGRKVSTDNNSWIFIDAEISDRTQQADHILNKDSTDIKLNFTVSKNEEHVSIKIKINRLQINLGERAHHYLMLYLARKRLTDLQQGLENSEQGWIDKDILCQQTGLDEKHVNLQIYRFRKQLIQANPAAIQLLQIIERRRGELRFAFTSIQIKGGNDLMKIN